MRLRKNVRPPIRFEDEEVMFQGPPRRKHTIPAYPETLATQVVTFNPNVTPAVFPSLSLDLGSTNVSNGVASVSRSGNLSSDNSESQLDATHLEDHAQDDSNDGIDWENSNDVLIKTRNAQAEHKVRWSSLEKSVQYAIWTNTRKKYAQEDAAALLQLSDDELLTIRIDAERRGQCLIDSATIIKRLHDIDDYDGSLLQGFQPYLLTAQTFETAFAQQVQLGLQYLSQLKLSNPTQYIGFWIPDPEGSGYLKSTPEFSMVSIAQGEGTTPAPQRPESDLGTGIVTSASASPTTLVISEPHEVRSLSITSPNQAFEARKARQKTKDNYSRQIQENAARIRHLRGIQNFNPVDQAVPATTFVAPTSLSTTQDSMAPAQPAHAAIIIRKGFGPVSSSTQQTLRSSNQLQEEIWDARPTEPLHDMRTSPIVSKAVNTTPVSDSPRIQRSSGSMSLRNRDSLKETEAMADLRQNKAFWAPAPTDNSLSGTDDDQSDAVQTPQDKRVQLKIDNKNARASIFAGDQKIAMGYSHFDRISQGVEEVTLHDIPDHFVKHFRDKNFPQGERMQLLNKPIQGRNLAEMLLVYGSYAWNKDAPWNMPKGQSLFVAPREGNRMITPENMSKLGKMLVHEWNRHQEYGIGQDVMEVTDVGIVIVNFHFRILVLKRELEQIKGQWQHTLEQSPGREIFKCQDLYNKAQREVAERVQAALETMYQHRFEQLGIHQPRFNFRGPVAETVRPVPDGGDGASRQALSDLLPFPSEPLRKSCKVPKKVVSGSDLGPGSDFRNPKTPPADELGISGKGKEEKRRSRRVLGPAIVMSDMKMEGRDSPTQDEALQQILIDSPSHGRRQKEQKINKNASGTPAIAGTSHDIIPIEDLVYHASFQSGAKATVSAQDFNIPEPKSPEAPAYSPLSDNEKFPFTLNVPGKDIMKGMRADDNNLGELLFHLSSSFPHPVDTVPANTSGLKDGHSTRDYSSAVLEVPVERESVPSVETAHSQSTTTQEGSPDPGIRIKLALNQSNKKRAEKTSQGKSKKKRTDTPGIAVEENSIIPSASVSSRVTTPSMTHTPTPIREETQPPASNSQSTAGATRSTKKRRVVSKAGTPGNVPAQTDTNGDGATTTPPRTKPKVTGTPRTRQKKNTPGPVRAGGKRGPYKKTREKLEREKAAKAALEETQTPVDGLDGEEGIGAEVDGDVEMVG